MGHGGRRRRRHTGDAWWNQQYGGMPVWGLLSAVAAFGAFAIAIIVAQPSSTAIADPSRTLRPVPPAIQPTPTAASALPLLGGVADGDRVLIVGDSFVQGLGLDSVEEEGWAYLLPQAMGWGEPAVDGVGGTGFAATLVAGTEPYADRLSGLGDLSDVKLVLLQGSINDIQADPADVSAGVRTTVDEVASLAPSAAVAIIGPMTADAAYGALASIYEKAATAAGTTFVPATGDASPLPAAPNELLQPDGWHPTALGQAAIADYLETQLGAATVTP